MAKPWVFQTPDTRLRHLRFSHQRELERKERLDAQDVERLNRAKEDYQTELGRRADLDRRDEVAEGLRFEQKRKADLDVAGAPQYEPEGRMPRRMAPTAPTPLPMPAPAPLVPTATPTPIPRGIPIAQEPRESLFGRGVGLVKRGLGEAVEFIEEQPFAGPFYRDPYTGRTAAGTAVETIGKGYRRFVNPAEAWLLQESAGARGAGIVGMAAEAGVPGAKETAEEARKRPIVNPLRAAMGDEEEIARGQEVLNEMGVGRYVVEAILDPLNIVPIVGFTKFDDFARMVKGVSRLTGEARVAAVARLTEKPLVQDALRGMREAGEAGGPRVGREAEAISNLDAEIARLQDQLTFPDITAAEKADIRLWLQEAKANRAAFQRIQEGRPVLPQERAPAPVRPAEGVRPPVEPPYAAARGGQPPDRPDALLSAAAGSPPGELATDLWRRWTGRLNEAFTRVVRIEGADAYRLAKGQGIRISKTRTPEMETALEKFWLRSPVESFDEKWRPVAEDLYRALDEETALMQAADPSFSERMIDSYFPHLFKPRRGGGGMPPPRRLGQKPGFLRHRKLEGPLGEILEAHPDLDLYTWDPVEFVIRRRMAGEQYRANLEVLERMRAMGLVKRASDAPADWVVPRSPAFQPRAIPGKPDVSTAPLAVPRDAAKVMNDWYGTSFMSTNAVLDTVRKGAITAKFTKVFGGLFQYFDYTMRTLGMAIGYQDVRAIPGIAKAWARAWVPGIDRKLLRFEMADPVSSRLIKDGLNIAGPTDIVEATFRQNFGEEILPIPLLKQALDFMATGSYQRMHREAVLTVGKTLYRSFRNEGLDEVAASLRAVKMAHERMSTLPAWQSIWRSPGMRDVMRTFGLFSMGETEGWFRNFFRLFQPKQAKDAARFWFGMMAVTAGLANGINLAVTGKPLSPDQWKPFTFSKDDRTGLPFVGYNTRFMRPELPFTGPFGRKEYLDLLGQADTPFRWALDPIFGLQTRLAQIPSTAISALYIARGEKPLWGKRPQGAVETAEWAAGQIAPIPVTGALEERSRIGEWGAGLQATGWNVMGEPLRALLARRFEEIHGRPFNPEVDYRQAEQTPELKPILDEMSRMGLEYESPGALRAETAAAVRLEREQVGGLITEAQRIEQGQPGAEAAFAEAYENVSDEIRGANSAIYLDMARKKSSTEGKKLQAYYDHLDTWRSDPKYRDPVSGELDQDAGYAEADRLYDLLSKETRTAMENDIKSIDPLVAKYEPQYREAARIRTQIYDEPQYAGLTLEEEAELKDFVNFVRMTWERAKRENPDLTISQPEAAIDLGRQNNDPKLGEAAAYVLARKAPPNPKRIELVLENQDLLSRYFPYLVSKILPVELERTELGEEEFERVIAR